MLAGLNELLADPVAALDELGRQSPEAPADELGEARKALLLLALGGEFAPPPT